jgi:hypothetical protein
MHPRLRKPNAQTAVRNCSRQPCLTSVRESQVSTFEPSQPALLLTVCAILPAFMFKGFYILPKYSLECILLITCY